MIKLSLSPDDVRILINALNRDLVLRADSSPTRAVRELRCTLESELKVFEVLAAKKDA